MQINKQAPVLCSKTIEINAPRQKVWTILSDINNWPNWNPAVKEAKLLGPLAVGSKFIWKAGVNLTSELVVVEPDEIIAWTGKTMGINVIHIYKLTSKANKTIVVTEESAEGVLVTLLKGYMQKTFDQALNDGLLYLKKATE